MDCEKRWELLTEYLHNRHRALGRAVNSAVGKIEEGESIVRWQEIQEAIRYIKRLKEGHAE